MIAARGQRDARDFRNGHVAIRPRPVVLTGGSYDPATGMVTISASAPGPGGAVFDYAIQGQVEGNTMTGAWSHDDQQGDFVLTMM